MQLGLGDGAGGKEVRGTGGGEEVGIAGAAWMALEGQLGDIQCVEMFITLAYFDIKWGM